MMTELPDIEFEKRIKSIQEKLAENSYDAYLVQVIENEAE